MISSTFQRIGVLSVLFSNTVVHGCYQIDLHHQLPCEINIDPPVQVTTSPTSATPHGPPTPAPSINNVQSTESPTAIIAAVTTLQPSLPPSTPPTFAPSSLPIAPPTLHPTVLPTSVPTVLPTSVPTVLPTAEPTVSPTSVPTVLLTSEPTADPTLPPSSPLSSEPTSPPSSSPTSKPTKYPTSKPTASPTTKPKKTNCQANQDGFFGGLSSNPVLISYGYELETTPVSEDTLQNEVLPALKSGFVNSLLPNLFGNQCGGRRLRFATRRLEILGVSARPDDVPLSNVPCKSSLANVANNCSVISGELTLFTSANATDEGSLIQSILKAGMANGTYVTTDSRIVRVTYANLGSYSSLNGGNNGNPKSSNASNDSNRVFLAIIPAAAAAVLVVAAIIWRRRRRFAGDADDSTNPSASRAPRTTGGSVPGLDEMPPGLPAPMSLEEGTVYTTESNV